MKEEGSLYFDLVWQNSHFPRLEDTGVILICLRGVIGRGLEWNGGAREK